MQLSVGEKIPLAVLLADRTNNKIIKAIITSRKPPTIVDEDVVVPSEGNIDGYYYLEIEAMPVADLIDVTYFIFQPDGITLITTISEQFQRRTPSYDAGPLVGIIDDNDLQAVGATI